MKGIKFWTAVSLILALVAVGWTVGHWYLARQENARQVAAVERAVAGLDEGQLNHQRNLAKWYNYQLEQGTTGLRGAYQQILNFGDGAMAVLEVPELNLKLPVYHGCEGTVGHDPGSALPLGGGGRHTVLYLTKRYNWSEEIPVYIDCAGLRLSYRVVSVQVMPLFWPTGQPTEAGQDLLTLVYDRGGTRTLVRCVRSTGLVLRETAEEKLLKRALQAAAAPFLLIIPAICRERTFAGGVHLHQICGFCRKNREKTKLF